MNTQRRFFLKSIAIVGGVLALPKLLFAARPEIAFEAKGSDAVIKELFGVDAIESDQISLKVPEIAENGAVVPVTIKTDLEDVSSISILVDENPTPLSATFDLTPAVEANISARIKMGQSSNVRAVVKAGDKVYFTTKEVKVTIGGCGG